jgi:serine/threonine-protein kinase
VSPKHAKSERPVLERLSSMLEEQYTLKKEIGRGGMSVVYLAKDLRHDRPVAVKLVQPEITTAGSAERFLREIQITARLQHPHILPLLDSGASDDLLYYIMPHIDGESLRDRLAAGDRLSFEEAVGITQQVAAALQHAHDHGIIHRDVKPENILLSAGLAVLSDFGVASAIGDDENDSTTRFTVGTPAYMAPEQAQREKVDHRADQYSLACVLFEMLTGAPPYFAGTVGETIQRRLTEPVPRLSDLRPDLPAELDDVFERALARKPRNRYESAEELSQALDGLPPPQAVQEMERVKPVVTRVHNSPGLLKQATPSPPRDLGRRLLVLGGILSLIVIILLALFGDAWWLGGG